MKIALSVLFTVLVVPLLGSSEQLNLTQVNEKAFVAINRAVPAGAYPQTCITDYSIKSHSSSQPVRRNPPAAAEIEKLLAGVKTIDDLKALSAQLDAKKAKEQTEEKVEQLTATLSVKKNGISQTMALFDLPTSVDNPLTIFSNISDVLKNFSDRICPNKQSQIHSDDGRRPVRERPQFVKGLNGVT
jgi:hypothetical protein